MIPINLNLYEWIMSQYLPNGDFEWTTAEEMDEFDLSQMKDDEKIGYFYMCNLNH